MVLDLKHMNLIEAALVEQERAAHTAALSRSSTHQFGFDDEHLDLIFPNLESQP